MSTSDLARPVLIAYCERYTPRVRTEGPVSNSSSLQRVSPQEARGQGPILRIWLNYSVPEATIPEVIVLRSS